MDGPPIAVEPRQLEELSLAVDDLRRRVAELEKNAGSSPVIPSPVYSLPIPGVAPGDSTNLLAALGRLLLGIAGAYLLRAITEAGLLPHLAGTLLGLVYAAAWLLSANRIAFRNPLAVAVPAVTAAIIAGPLLWESTVRLHSLTPAGAGAALALFIVLGQVVAWRRDRPVVAAVTALAGSAIALVLILATFNLVPFTLAVLIAAAFIEFEAARDRGLRLRWIVALTLDFCAILLIYVATLPQGLPEGYAPVPMQLLVAMPAALVAIYLTSTIARTLVRGLRITGFEIAQVAMSVTLAILCGLRVAPAAGLSAVGAACLALGAFCYLAVLLKPGIRNRNFHAYATFSLLMVSIGSSLFFRPPTLSMLWAALGVAAIAFGERSRVNTLTMHGAFYVAAAAAASGSLAYSAVTMTGAVGPGWPPVTVPALLSAAAALLCYGLVLYLRKTPMPAWTERAASAILAALVCWSAVGLAAGMLIGPRTDASLASTLRTALIVFAAIALGWFGPLRNLTELTWILYPWMIFGALKLFAEDFRQGRPVTLFLSLLLYGAALVALPRLLRRESVRPDRS